MIASGFRPLNSGNAALGDSDPVVHAGTQPLARNHLASEQRCLIPGFGGHHDSVVMMLRAGKTCLGDTSLQQVMRTDRGVEAEHVHSEPKVGDGGEVDVVPGVHLGRVLPGEILLRVTEESGDADDLFLRGRLDL